MRAKRGDTLLEICIEILKNEAIDHEVDGNRLMFSLPFLYNIDNYPSFEELENNEVNGNLAEDIGVIWQVTEQHVFVLALIPSLKIAPKLQRRTLTFCNKWNNSQSLGTAIFCVKNKMLSLEYSFYLPKSVDNDFIKEYILESFNMMAEKFFELYYEQVYL